jgi:hypothetical protein
MATQTLVDKEFAYLSEFTACCRSIPDQDGERLRAEIARLAYLKAERRGFAPGYEVSDWLEAEREVTQHLKGRRGLDFMAP